MTWPNVSPRKAIFFFFFILLIAYCLFQARFLILGPRLSVSLADNTTLEEPVLKLQGKAENATFLSLDDRQIFTDESGIWQEKLLVSPGLNIIKLVARDRFGRETEKLIHVVLN